MDKLIHGLAADSTVRVMAAVTTETVREAVRRHQTSPTASVAHTGTPPSTSSAPSPPTRPGDTSRGTPRTASPWSSFAVPSPEPDVSEVRPADYAGSSSLTKPAWSTSGAVSYTHLTLPTSDLV